MLKWIAAGLLAQAFASDTEAFWKSKAKYYDRIQNGEVIVSVTSTDVSPAKPKYVLHALGGGQVTAPCAFVYQEAQKYEDLARLSSYLSDAKYSAETHTLRVTISAFGHSQPLEVAVEAAAEGKPRQLQFTMLSGPMRGFHWRLDFAEVKTVKCDVGLDGEFKYDEAPIRRMFLDFGMEIVLKGMAFGLRSHLQTAYRAASRSGS